MTSTPKKAVVLSSLKSNISKEREGDWIDDKDLGDDVWFLVRSTNYPAYLVARDQAQARLARQYPNASLAADHEDYAPIPEEVMAKENGENIATHLLLGWRGFDTDYNAGDALEALVDPEYRTLRTRVLIAATKVGRQEVKFVEGAAKN